MSKAESRVGTLILTVTMAVSVVLWCADMATAQTDEMQYTTEFNLADRTLVSEGESAFFVLKPGYQLIFEGEEEPGVTTRFVMTVLDETLTVDVPGVGPVEARIIDEREWADGEKVEYATSYFVMDAKNGDVFDLGDDVEIFNDDGTVSTDGTWRTGRPDADGVAQAGLFIPGSFLLGSRYYQQLAEGMSMECAEHVEMGLKIETPAGTFEGCVKVLEKNFIEPGGSPTYKTHCPGIGLIGEDELALVQYGYNLVPIEGLVAGGD